MDATKYADVVAILGAPDETKVNGDQTYGWWAPVFDRVLADCVYGNHKGCIDSIFLNRVESNTEFIAYYLRTYYIPYVTIVDQESAWNRQMYSLIGNFTRIQQNILDVETSEIVRESTPTFNMAIKETSPTYVMLNAMEEILWDMKMLLDSMPYVYRISGTFSCGNDYLMQIIRR